MDALWNACYAAGAVMVGVPLLAGTVGVCSRTALRLVRRRRPRAALQLSLPLASNSRRKVQALRESLGLHG